MLPVAILAGGLATRLRPLTETIPKSLIDVAGEPFVAHQLRLLRANGVEFVVMCVSHLGERIEEYVGDGGAFGLKVDYSWDGDSPLGTGGAVRKALPKLGQAFLVMYGDSYLTCDYRDVVLRFEESEKPALMTVYRNEGQWDSSNVEYRDGAIVRYNKRNRTPAMQYIDYGLGVFDARVFAQKAATAFDLADLFQELLANNQLAAAEIRERFYEIGSFDGIESLSKFLASGIRAATQ